MVWRQSKVVTDVPWVFGSLTSPCIKSWLMCRWEYWPIYPPDNLPVSWLLSFLTANISQLTRDICSDCCGMKYFLLRVICCWSCSRHQNNCLCFKLNIVSSVAVGLVITSLLVLCFNFNFSGSEVSGFGISIFSFFVNDKVQWLFWYAAIIALSKFYIIKLSSVTSFIRLLLSVQSALRPVTK